MARLLCARLRLKKAGAEPSLDGPIGISHLTRRVSGTLVSLSSTALQIGRESATFNASRGRETQAGRLRAHIFDRWPCQRYRHAEHCRRYRGQYALQLIADNQDRRFVIHFKAVS